jgi:hypothetical protein
MNHNSDNPNDHVGIGFSFDLFHIDPETDAPTEPVTRWHYDERISLETIALRFALSRLDRSRALDSMGNPNGDIIVSAKPPGGYFRRFVFKYDWLVTPVLISSEP